MTPKPRNAFCRASARFVGDGNKVGSGVVMIGDIRSQT
jgi:hypothetical protein